MVYIKNVGFRDKSSENSPSSIFKEPEGMMSIDLNEGKDVEGKKT